MTATASIPYAERRDLSAVEFLEGIAGLEGQDYDDALWLRASWDRAFFCTVMFPERFTSPFNRMHEAFLARPKTPFYQRKTDVKVADAAPRGGAKSTIASFAEIVHDVCYGFEAFVGILSTTFDLSMSLVKDLFDAFKTPELYPDLHAVYGPFKVVGSQTDFVVHVQGGVTVGTRIKAFSFGGSIRGVKHAGIRLTKLLFDDAEHPERVRSPLQRFKTKDFVTKDALKAGLTDGGTIFQWVGTVLHPDSALANILKGAKGWKGWKTKRWQSIIRWPKRMDLWEQCRQVWAGEADVGLLDDLRRTRAELINADDADTRTRLEAKLLALEEQAEEASTKAREWYLERQGDMDEGAEVLWPEVEPLWRLTVLLWSDGAASFHSEKQNQPSDPERQPLNPDTFRRCRFDGRDIHTADGRIISLRGDCDIAVHLDPRASKEVERNDFAAIATVARDRRTGRRFVLRCRMERVSPTQQRAWMWSEFDQLGRKNVRYSYENNGFAALNDEGFERSKHERQHPPRGQQQRPWNLDVVGIPSTDNKNDRILAMEPDLVNGFIEFADTIPQDVLEQFREIPSGSHDDGPDAIQRADERLRSGHTARSW